jgi:hypothetical protein
MDTLILKGEKYKNYTVIMTLEQLEKELLKRKKNFTTKG